MKNPDFTMATVSDTASPILAGDNSDSLKAQIKDHIEDLRHDPELVTLFAQGGTSGVSEINAYARRRLADELGMIKQAKTSLEETARDNLTLQAQTYKAVLSLMDAHTLSQLDEVISTVLPVILTLDHVHVFLENGQKEKHAFESHACTAMTPVLSGFTNRFLGTHDHILGQVLAETERLYGEDRMIKSHALTRLSVAEHEGFVAFGSYKKTWFSPSQSPTLLDFLARVLERRLSDVISL